MHKQLFNNLILKYSIERLGMHTIYKLFAQKPMLINGLLYYNLITKEQSIDKKLTDEIYNDFQLYWLEIKNKV